MDSSKYQFLFLILFFSAFIEIVLSKSIASKSLQETSENLVKRQIIPLPRIGRSSNKREFLIDSVNLDNLFTNDNYFNKPFTLGKSPTIFNSFAKRQGLIPSPRVGRSSFKSNAVFANLIKNLSSECVNCLNYCFDEDNSLSQPCIQACSQADKFIVLCKLFNYPKNQFQTAYSLLSTVLNPNSILKYKNNLLNENALFLSKKQFFPPPRIGRRSNNNYFFEPLLTGKHLTEPNRMVQALSVPSANVKPDTLSFYSSDGSDTVDNNLDNFYQNQPLSQTEQSNQYFDYFILPKLLKSFMLNGNELNLDKKKIDLVSNVNTAAILTPRLGRSSLQAEKKLAEQDNFLKYLANSVTSSVQNSLPRSNDDSKFEKFKLDSINNLLVNRFANTALGVYWKPLLNNNTNQTKNQPYLDSNTKYNLNTNRYIRTSFVPRLGK